MTCCDLLTSLPISSLFQTECVYVICYERYLLSFHTEELANIKVIQTRLEKLKSIKLTPSWILYVIMDNIVG